MEHSDHFTHLSDFGALIDQHTGPVGRVVTSERTPAGAHTFHFWAGDGEAARNLDIGHIVVAFSEEAAVIGLLEEPQRYGDLATFLDDYFDYHGEDDIAAALASTRPEILVFACRTLATRHLRADVRSRRPPVSGPVYYATPEAIRLALGAEGYSGVPIPVLLHRNGNYTRDADGTVLTETLADDTARPIFQHTAVDVDSDYLLGPEAGHANWTGQSGLATKTSHALFAISSVFQRAPQKVAALMFNVKGPDLLWLDKPAYVSDDEAATLLERDTSLRLPGELDRHMYARMGITPQPFTNLRIFAPFRPGLVPHDDHSDSVRIDAPRYLADLNTQRTARGETGCVHPILWTLEEVLRYPHRVFEGGDLDDKFFGFLNELRSENVNTLRKFDALMAKIDDYFAIPDAENKRPQEWNGHHRFTIMKARNRIKSLASKCGGLLAQHHVEYGDQPHCDEVFTDRELRVIDLAHCNSTVQELLVSATISRVWQRAEAGKLGVEKVIIFVDELNKYAPGGARGGLRDTLVDIAARGRHLNVVLFGAQQFRSKVDDEVVGNAATSFYGRIGDEEIISPSYRSLSEPTKAELLRVPKGTLLMRHAHVPVPVFGVFPRPPALPGANAQKLYGSEAEVDPVVPLYRKLCELSAQVGMREPTLPQVRADLGDRTAAQVDRMLETLGRYRVGGRTSPYDYFRQMCR